MSDQQSSHESEHRIEEESDKAFEQLKLLFDYTKFHILLYTTLITLMLGLFIFGTGASGTGDAVVAKLRLPMKFVVFFFLIAGGAGGVIGSSISSTPRYSKLKDFLDDYISPYNIDIKILKLKGHTWINIEHGAFWLGITIAVFSFFRT